MTPEQRLLVLMELRGGPEYAASMEGASAATGNLARKTEAAGAAMTATTKRTWLQNQALFTARRYAFYATLAITALAFEVVKLGFSYLSAMQTSRVALEPVIRNTKALNNELDTLFKIAALSPFLFKDTVVAFRQMYAAFHPLGISLGTTNQTIQMIVNALSFAGKTTPQAFNRVSIALQHMAFLGRPAGQQILQLARDGLPIYAALNKELHLSSQQMRNISGSGITATQVIRALNRYVATTPGYMNAALRQSNLTLLGSFREFKDIISRAMGQSEQGAFGGLTAIFRRVNEQLAPFLTHNRAVGIYDIVKAFDAALTPKTHAIISVFELLSGVLSGLNFQFMLLGRIVQGLLFPLGLFNRGSASQEFIMRQLGRVLSVLIFTWIVYRASVIASVLATELLTVWTWALTVAAFAYRVALTLQVYWQLRALVVQSWLDAATAAYVVTLRLVTVGLRLTAIAMLRLVGIVLQAAIAFFSLDLATLGWIGLAIGVVALLVILYFKWKAFRDIVNLVWRDLIYFAPVIALVFSPMIAALVLAIRYWKELRGLIHDVHKELTGGGFHVTSNKWGLFGAGFDWIKHPHFATGGVMPYSGAAWVGEHGPELARLPGGTQIIPNNELARGTRLHITITPQAIYFNQRMVGQVISDVVTDKDARS